MKILKELKNGNIKNVYLFYGEEKYKLKVYKDALKQLIPYENEMNFSYFEGKNIDFKAVYDSVMTVPFFAEKRLVIVENCGRLKAKAKAAEEAGAEEAPDDDAQAGIILDILNDMPETTCLVFIEEKILKTKKEVKLILKKGAIEECAKDSPADIAKWIQKGFKAFGKNADVRTAMLLIDRTGTDYTALKHEIEKIASFVGERDIVTEDDISSVTVSNIESKIFDMLTFMVEKNGKAVIDKYYDMLKNKDEPRMIMAMIRRQFRLLLQVAELSAQGMSEGEIASVTKNHPYAVKKMRSYARGVDIAELIRILDLINETDMKTKNGSLEDRLGVELLLIEASR